MVKTITGPNFSGKSFYLQCYTGFPIENVHGATRFNPNLFCDSRSDLYLGPIPDYFFSGFFDTVKDEVFKSNNGILWKKKITEDFIDALNLSGLYSRNPFTLSGGEKTIFLVLAFAIAEPRSLCIDCTLEQLAYEWKISLLDFLQHMSLPEIIIADNRVSEMPSHLYTKMEYKRISDKLLPEMKLSNISGRTVDVPIDIERHNLDVRDLSFAYGKKEIFKNLNFTVETGKIYHLKGKNGAGKSTLSKILSGILKPNKTTTILFNQNQVTPYNHPGKYVGYTFQQPDDQLFAKSVKEELNLSKQKTSIDKNYIESLIESFGLKNLLDFHPFELPVAMRKRLSIAAALSANRPFYVLDEPTLYQDDQNVAELKQLLNKLVLSGKGIILISHNQDFVRSFDNLEIINLTQN